MRGELSNIKAKIPPEFDPAGAPDVGDEFAVRAKNTEELAKVQAHQRNVSGVSQETGEMTSAVGVHVEGRESAEKAKEKERKEKTDTQILLALQNYESGLIEQYGENFAENLFADLREDGLIEDDEYNRIMAITDAEERRRAIAAAIQEGIESGRIDPDKDLQGHPWAGDWLHLHEKATMARDREAQLGLTGQRNANDMSAAAKGEAIDIASRQQSDVQQEIDATTETKETTNTLDQGGNSSLGNLGLNGM